MDKKLSLLGFLALTLGGGWLVGFVSRPGIWYAELNKPAFMPPNWVFAPVWIALYTLIALAGWRLFTRRPKGVAMKLWFIQLALNFLWIPVFFSVHAIDASLGFIAILWLTVVGLMARAWPIDRTASLLLAPYLAWTSFAAVLNAAILRLN